MRTRREPVPCSGLRLPAPPAAFAAVAALTVFRPNVHNERRQVLFGLSVRRLGDEKRNLPGVGFDDLTRRIPLGHDCLKSARCRRALLSFAYLLGLTEVRIARRSARNHPGQCQRRCHESHPFRTALLSVP